LVTFEGDRISSVESRALDVVRWAEVVVPTAGLSSLDDVLSAAQLSLARAAEAAQGRLLAFRVKLVGATSLDALLRASRDKLTEELCSLSYGVGGAGAWLEKLVLATERPARGATLGDDALLEIDRALAELLSAEAPEALGEYLGDLSRKLPAEVLELVPELRVPSAELAAELALDVRSLLRERLATGLEGA
jgi:exonuclease SbcD